MKNKSHRISVLMGIYNCAPTLQEALNSLYAQTYQNFKVILCDDGSKDETLKIAEENARLHPDKVIVLINERNMGLNYTLNQCLKYADSEYIARMDGDDICDPTRFEKEINFLDTHPEYSLVSTPMYYFDDQGVFRIGKGGGEPQLRSFVKKSPFCHAPCMARTEAFKKVGGYSDFELVQRVEDYHLWMKLYMEGYKGYMLEEPLYSMRDDRNATIRRNLKARRNESYVKYQIWKNFKLPFWMIIYCLRPLLVAMIPNSIYTYLHKQKK